MGLMTQELFDAINNNKPVYPVLSFTIGSVTKRYSTIQLESASLGSIEGKILSWSPIENGISVVNTSLRSLSVTVEIDDTDRSLDVLLNGQYNRVVNGSVATGTLVSPMISTDSYFNFFSGVIKEYRKSGPFKYEFVLRTNEEPLKGRIKTPTAGRWDFPLIGGEYRDNPIPLLFGTFSSTNVGSSAGMLPTIFVGAQISSSRTYILSHGVCDSVTKVFVDGTQAGSFSNSGIIINGRPYHYINGISTPAPTDTSIITVDSTGVTDTATAAGNPVDNPARQLQAILSTWVFRSKDDPRNDVFPTSGVPIDFASFDAAANYFDRQSMEGSIYLGGNDKGEEIVNTWMNNTGCTVYWNSSGELSVIVNDWFVEDVYDSNSTLRSFNENDEIGAGFRYVYDIDLLADEISGSFVYSAADEKFFRTIRVKDGLANQNRLEAYQLLWARSEII